MVFFYEHNDIFEASYNEFSKKNNLFLAKPIQPI